MTNEPFPKFSDSFADPYCLCWSKKQYAYCKLESVYNAVSNFANGLYINLLTLNIIFASIFFVGDSYGLSSQVLFYPSCKVFNQM